MPRSKRDKKVSLTKTKKKISHQFKAHLIDEIRIAVDQYARIFVFSVKNMRAGKLKDLRVEWRDSRFIFGKNKIMQVAFGKTPDEEFKKNLMKISKQITGQCGMLFTNKEKDEVLNWFNEYSDVDYARAGVNATETVELPEGPLTQIPFSMETQLRQLGLPTSLQNGVVMLLRNYTVCKEGEVLNPQQTKLLKFLGNKMAEFKIIMKCVWSKDGSFEKFKLENKSEEIEEMNMD